MVTGSGALHVQRFRTTVHCLAPAAPARPPGTKQAHWPRQPKARVESADSPGMESFFVALGYGFAALLGVAVVVAVWEHGQLASTALAEPDPAPRPARVDLDLADLNLPPAGNDQEQRQTAVDTTMARMAQPPPGGTAAAPWIETRPMVALGPAVAPTTESAPP